MTIPKKLKIGAHIFTVKVVPLEKCGELDRDALTISIADTLHDSQKGSTFIHEILHGINSELNHTVLDSLAEQLYQVLSDNKMLK